MEWLGNFFEKFGHAFKWFFILQPWEQALRVRAGKNIKKFEGGIHFKIPYIDAIFKQNCRTRISGISEQTITTRDGHAITCGGSLKYKVLDVEPLYMKLHMAEDTIGQGVAAMLAEYAAENDKAECTPRHLMRYVNEAMDLEQYGLSKGRFLLTDYAAVRTYRLISGEMNKYFGHSLQTDTEDTNE